MTECRMCTYMYDIRLAIDVHMDIDMHMDIDIVSHIHMDMTLI